MTRRRTLRLILALVVSALVNVGLFSLVTVMSHERPQRVDITEPMAVSLVRFEEEEAVDELEIVDHSEPEPDAELSRKQLQELLADALAQISPEQRAVVELTYYHGYSYPEIAQIVGCPPNTVKTRMYHARQRLKKLLPQTSRGLIDQQGVSSWL